MTVDTLHCDQYVSLLSDSDGVGSVFCNCPSSLEGQGRMAQSAAVAAGLGNTQRWASESNLGSMFERFRGKRGESTC